MKSIKLIFTVLSVISLFFTFNCTVPESEGNQSETGSKTDQNIAVTQNDIEFFSNGDPYVFASCLPSAANQNIIFLIKNTGGKDLIITNTSITNSSNFNLTPISSLTISPGKYNELSIKFTPKSVGVYNSILSVYSNDPDQMIFSLKLTGRCVSTEEPKIEIKKNNIVLSSNGQSNEFPAQKNNTTGSPEIFIITNIGIQDLIISNIVLSDTQNYLMTNSTSMVIKSGENRSINIAFSPVICGDIESSVTITSNDIAQTNFIINLKGLSYDSRVYKIPVNSGYLKNFSNPIIYKSKLYFAGDPDTGGTYLFSFDGNNFIKYNYTFNYPIIYNDNLIFYSGGSKIMKFDGNNFTVIDKYIDDLTYIAGMQRPIIFNGKLYFYSNLYSTNDIYETDGINIKPLNRGTSHFLHIDSYSPMIVYNSKLYICGYPNDHYISSQRLYEFDGSEIKNINTGTSDYYEYFNNPIIYNNELFFEGLDNVFGDYPKMYKYNETSGIQNINTGTSDYKDTFDTVIVYNSKLYFKGISNSSYSDFYEYDGSKINNLSRSSAVYNGCYNSNYYLKPIIYNSKIYIPGISGSSGPVIFEFDGISIKDVNTGNSHYTTDFEYPIVYDSKLYFCGYNGTNDVILNFDGSEIKNLYYGDSGYNYDFENPIVYNSKLYFKGSNGYLFGCWE